MENIEEGYQRNIEYKMMCDSGYGIDKCIYEENKVFEDFYFRSISIHIIQRIDTFDRPIVYLLWGKYAQSKAERIKNPKACIIKTSHPSPLSANRGFFCSDCFKKCNKYLKANGAGEIDFQIKD